MKKYTTQYRNKTTRLHNRKHKIMSRQEIKYASKDYVNYLLDKQEYHNEKYTEYDIRQAFEMGAKWVEEHKNIQHDANEKPHAKKWLLVQLDKDDYKILCLKDLYIDLWCDWSSMEMRYPLQ